MIIQKLDVASIFLGFISMVENLCNAEIKYLQSDAGGELIDKGLQALFACLVLSIVFPVQVHLNKMAWPSANTVILWS